MMTLLPLTPLKIQVWLLQRTCIPGIAKQAPALCCYVRPTATALYQTLSTSVRALHCRSSYTGKAIDSSESPLGALGPADAYQTFPVQPVECCTCRRPAPSRIAACWAAAGCWQAQASAAYHLCWTSGSAAAHPQCCPPSTAQNMSFVNIHAACHANCRSASWSNPPSLLDMGIGCCASSMLSLQRCTQDAH